MNNKELREEIKSHNLKYWQIADALGISASTFTVWMRHELTGEKRKAVLTAIQEIINHAGD